MPSESGRILQFCRAILEFYEILRDRVDKDLKQR